MYVSKTKYGRNGFSLLVNSPCALGKIMIRHDFLYVRRVILSNFACEFAQIMTRYFFSFLLQLENVQWGLGQGIGGMLVLLALRLNYASSRMLLL